MVDSMYGLCSRTHRVINEVTKRLVRYCSAEDATFEGADDSVVNNERTQHSDELHIAVFRNICCTRKVHQTTIISRHLECFEEILTATPTNVYLRPLLTWRRLFHPGASLCNSEHRRQ